MRKNSLSPIDIIGITLGTIVMLIVIVGAILVARFGGLRGGSWSWNWNPGSWVEENWGGAQQREEKDQTVSGAFREIEVRTVAGEITVQSGSADGVQVHSVKTAPSPAALQAIQVQIEPQGDRLVIQEKRDMPPFRSGSISYSVTIPKGVKVITAHSVSGSITLQTDPGLEQSLDTISGSISTAIATDLHATSTSGMIRFASSGNTVDLRTVSGAIEGRIESLGAGGSVHAGTVSGSVSLGAFAALDASINLHSVSGAVSCAFPVTVSQQKNNTLQGQIGRGSASIDVGTVSGSIDIRK